MLICIGQLIMKTSAVVLTANIPEIDVVEW